MYRVLTRTKYLPWCPKERAALDSQHIDLQFAAYVSACLKIDGQANGAIGVTTFLNDKKNAQVQG